MKARCTTSPQRFVHRHLHDGALERMEQRATPAAMRLRRATVECSALTILFHGRHLFLPTRWKRIVDAEELPQFRNSLLCRGILTAL